ncbi:fluoride efflux transporter FluC [Nocardioides nitrophenolicus]|uniref:fluoride efflux transporter FluC n=1 Tax=Nocardioides nitrophenolicus TaxID=60489 RepID=UPI0019580C5A|nr:CrcB family protein [Nocardioides nitrophenolicus]MBM7516626.1 CrcB protein [Nocardioides nitrophenolicus]
MTPSPRLLVAVGAGGAVGAVARYAATQVAADGSGFPWTTFAINVSGSALLAGLLLLPLARRSPVWAAALGPGVLGGYTTFSATSEQARALLADGRPGLALAYVAGTLAACLLAVALVGRAAPPLPEEDEL